MVSVSISLVLGICLNWKEEVQETDQMADESRVNIGRSKSPPFRHLFVAILLIGLALGASYAGYLGASSAYSQLRTLVSRLTGTNNQPIQSANGSVCWSTSSSDGLVLQATLANAGRAVTVTMVVDTGDRKSTRLNSSHGYISYAVFCLKKKKKSKYIKY